VLLEGLETGLTFLGPAVTTHATLNQQPPSHNPDETWSDIHRDGEGLFRRVHDAVIEGAQACDQYALAHPDHLDLRYIAPLVAYTHDALRGAMGSWNEMSLVGVTTPARGLFEALIIADAVKADRSLAKRYFQWGYVSQLIDDTNDSTSTDAKKQAASDEIVSAYPEWAYKDKTGRTRFRNNWKAAKEYSVSKEARAHPSWEGWYESLYRPASAYVHPTAQLGLLALGDSAFLRQIMGQRAPLAGIFALNIVLQTSEVFGVDWRDGGACNRLVDQLEHLTNRSDSLYERVKAAKG
jgi:hypothetical protein